MLLVTPVIFLLRQDKNVCGEKEPSCGVTKLHKLMRMIKVYDIPL